MNIFKNKMAYIHHPVVLFIIGILVGMALVLLTVYGVIPIPLNICP